MMPDEPKRLVVLAAGRGTRLGEAAHGKPKAAVELAGQAILSWQLAAARHAGFSDIAVLRGYQPDKLPMMPANVRLIDNPVFDRTNMVFTLWLSRDHWADGVAISYGDIVYEPAVLSAVWATAAASPSGIAVVIDRDWEPYWTRRFGDPLIDAETLQIRHGRIVDIGAKPKSLQEIQGQYIGLTCFRGPGVGILRDLLDRAAMAHQLGERLLHPERTFPDAYMTDVLQCLIREGCPLLPTFIDGTWLEIDTPADLALAERCVQRSAGGTLLEIRR